MASLTVVQEQPRVGEPLSIVGEGFAPATVVTVKIDEFGVESEITSDAGGFLETDDEPDHAVATLTSDASNVTANDAVTIGSVTYTFKATVAVTANEVLIGANAAATLVNLKAAINAEGGVGYGTATVENPDVECVGITATTLLLAAKVGGTGGNALASTEASTHLSFGAGTLAGGAAGTGVSPILWNPVKPGTFLIVGTDGANEAETTVRVWASG